MSRWIVGAVAAAFILVAPIDAALADAPPGPSGPQSVAGLAKTLSPAVVNISSTHHAVPSRSAAPSKLSGGAVRDQNSDADSGDQIGPDEDSESLGSGFIVSADGLIVTNNHVVADADQVQVYLADGSHWQARVIGTDSKTDLAVLKIDAKRPLPFVSFGDSDAAQVGDWVMAIGDPFGLGGSVTLGIVSARNRDIHSGPYDSYIQTDASINQGNSGGPLFDMHGKVIGINTAIVAEGGSSIGIGFAIPGNLAKPVIDQLVQYGETRRGWLGVDIQDVTDEIAASLGRSDTHGAMVTDVTKPGPAAGLLDEGDVILDFDGKPVASMHDLPRLVAETPVGRPVPVRVLRDGREQVLMVTLAQLKDTDKVARRGDNPSHQSPAPTPAHETLDELLGLHLAPIDNLSRKTYALSDQMQGLVITSVKSGSDADQNGLAAGIVVTGVNQQKVSKLADVEDIVQAARKGGRTAVLFRVIDPTGAKRFIGVKFAG